MTTYTILQEAAVRLLGHASLSEIKMFALNARHRSFVDEDGEQPHLTDLSVRLESSANGDTTLAYAVVVETTLVQDSPEGDESEARLLAEIEVAYGALYDLSSEAGGATDDETKAFGFAVATMAVWPFIRAAIAQVLGDMNFLGSARLIPTITQRELAEAAWAADQTDASAEDSA